LLGREADRGSHSNAASRIRILCVDDHPLVREGLIAMLSRESDMEVVASAGTGERAIELFQAHRPDITIMDLQLPGIGGLRAISAIRESDSQARVIVLTMHQGEEDIYRALQAGAATYVLKDVVFEELVNVVRRVNAGECPLPSATAALLANRAGYRVLTPRELAVLELIGEGLQNKEIAATLGLTEQTVKVHIKNIFSKLDVSDRTEAFSVALRRGIVHIE